MGKKTLSRYLNELEKEQLEEQILDLYQRFKEVKEFYDFAFNPKEDKLLEDAKVKIYNEYFPLKRKRARKRRSIAQDLIRHFITLGVEPTITANLMFYNIEVAQSFCKLNFIGQDSFYKSILNSFDQAFKFVLEHHLEREFMPRYEAIVQQTEAQNWVNTDAFQMTILMTSV
jgi:hypothetical protein